jgi:hypothetical protein
MISFSIRNLSNLFDNIFEMCNSSSSLVTENHQRTDVYFPAVTIITEQNKNKT